MLLELFLAAGGVAADVGVAASEGVTAVGDVADSAMANIKVVSCSRCLCCICSLHCVTEH